MKIILAINNENIKNEFKKKYNEQVYKEDFSTKESVIEYLAKNKSENIVLITKDTLDGNLNGRLYIKHLKLACENVKIIYFVENLDSEYKRFLLSNEVLNIIEGDYIDVEKIFQIIDENRFMIYKVINTSIKKNSYNPLVAIHGTNGAGKSLVASILAKKIADEFRQKVAVLDFNIENPSLDIINNVEVNSNNLGQIVNDFDKELISSMEIKDYLISDMDNKRVAYLTNNMNLISTADGLNCKYYEFILNKLNNDFQNIIIDLSSPIFLDATKSSLTVANKILFVVNPNYISIRQAVKYLDVIEKLYNIPREKIGIIVNKITKNSLDNIQLKSLLKGYEIVLNINYSSTIESVINGELEKISFKEDYKKLFRFLEFKEYAGKNSSIRILKSIIKNNKSCINV